MPYQQVFKVLEMKVRDIFMNGYNVNIMRLHKANHDLWQLPPFHDGMVTENDHLENFLKL